MKLETEFRIFLQRQMLEWSLRCSPNDSNIQLHQAEQPEFSPSTWVELLVAPTALSFNQALLVCQCANQEWLAWVPDYGEILLHVDQFRPLSDDV